LEEKAYKKAMNDTSIEVDVDTDLEDIGRLDGKLVEEDYGELADEIEFVKSRHQK
jgi:hypothetical protein